MKQQRRSQFLVFEWVTTEDRVCLSGSLGVCLCVDVSPVEQQWSECYQQLCWASAPDPHQADYYVYSKQSPHFCLPPYKKSPDKNNTQCNTLTFVTVLKEIWSRKIQSFSIWHIHIHMFGESSLLFHPLLSVRWESYFVHPTHRSTALTLTWIFMAPVGLFLLISMTSLPSVQNFTQDKTSQIYFKFTVDFMIFMNKSFEWSNLGKV